MAEIAALDTTLAQVRRARLLGDLPLAVASAGVVPAEWLGWAEMQAELATLSSRGAQRTVAGADHYSIVTHEEHARALQQVVEVTLVADPLRAEVDGTAAGPRRLGTHPTAEPVARFEQGDRSAGRDQALRAAEGAGWP